MASELKDAFLTEMRKRFGSFRKLEGTQSLFEVGDGAARVYVRYSALHPRNRTFFGLRAEDLRELEGHPAVICFLWDGQSAPLLVPFSEYESVFQTTAPAGDGQYKAQVYPQENGTELYIAKAGRFNVESNLGWEALVALVDSSRLRQIPELSHAQIQTLLGGIGASKDHDIWIPPNDRGSLDWTLTPRFEVRDSLPQGFEKAENVLQEIDVIWTRRGSNEIGALFEVEHSTSVYSGLLRFNDIHLISPNARPRFSIVANENRRDVFVRQVNRPTFQASGLTALCNFLDYRDVFLWHTRSIESTTEIGGTA